MYILLFCKRNLRYVTASSITAPFSSTTKIWQKITSTTAAKQKRDIDDKKDDKLCNLLQSSSTFFLQNDYKRSNVVLDLDISLQKRTKIPDEENMTKNKNKSKKKRKNKRKKNVNFISSTSQLLGLHQLSYKTTIDSQLPVPSIKINTRFQDKLTTKHEHLQFLQQQQQQQNQYQQHLNIYSDGSAKRNGHVGASAYVLESQKFATWYLGHVESSSSSENKLNNYAAELKGIVLALQLIREELQQPYLHPYIYQSPSQPSFNSFSVYSDSQAVLFALQNKTFGHTILHEIINSLRYLIHTYPFISLFFDWVPAHVDIPGNHAADCLAKLAAHPPQIAIDHK